VRLKIDLSAAVQAVQEQPAAELTLAELVRHYTRVNIGDSDWRLKKWVEAFGTVSAWSLTSEQVETAAAAMLAHGYKPSSVNRDVSTLGSVYRWARERRLCPRGFRSPTLDIRRQPETIRRVEITPEQIEAVRACARAVRDRRFTVFVELLLDTGARKSELLERHWSDIDLEAGTINCKTTKTGAPRILHFRAETAALMRRVWRTMPADRLVFEGRVPGEPISFRAAWERATREAGVPDLHMHDLRHHAAADLLRAGVTIGVAAQVLGHSPQVLARRYGHLETGALRQAMEQRWRAAA
jgi:integrase